MLQISNQANLILKNQLDFNVEKKDRHKWLRDELPQ